MELNLVDALRSRVIEKEVSRRYIEYLKEISKEIDKLIDEAGNPHMMVELKKLKKRLEWMLRK